MQEEQGEEEGHEEEEVQAEEEQTVMVTESWTRESNAEIVSQKLM